MLLALYLRYSVPRAMVALASLRPPARGVLCPSCPTMQRPRLLLALTSRAFTRRSDLLAFLASDSCAVVFLPTLATQGKKVNQNSQAKDLPLQTMKSSWANLGSCLPR